MDLDRCLGLLKSARSDNERMAALLLVTKLVRSGEVGGEERRRVFDAVGFSFINRLLATRQIPEGCKTNPFQKIAVTILACFCTDPELVIHPQVTSKIPLFNELILQRGTSSDAGLVADSLQCLQAMAATPLGLQRLWRSGTLEALAECSTTLDTSGAEARCLLLSMLADSELVREGREKLGLVVGTLAREFRTNQDALKFLLCDTIYSILAVTGEVLQCMDQSWVQDVAVALKDILTSKIDMTQRSSSLRLSALLCHLFGVEWSLKLEASDQRPGSFFRLLVNLVSVEVRMALEEREITEVITDAVLLSSCFIVLEQAVVLIANLSEKTEHPAAAPQPLSQEELLQLHTTLTEAFSSVVYFLHSLEQLDPDSVLLREGVVFAAVRVLGAWLAEENLVLSTDVYKLLPFLMKLCDASCTEESLGEPVHSATGDQRASDHGATEPENLIKFLLPGLCHMTAEDKPRRILLEADVQRILVSHFQRLSSQPHTSEVGSQLCLCCGVLMNVCVCEPSVVKQDGAFSQLAAHLTKLTSEGFMADGGLLALNVSLLFLMIVRRQDIAAQVPLASWHNILQLLLSVLTHSCPHTVRGTKVGEAHSSLDWSEVSELWFLAIQELTVLVKNLEDLKPSLTKSHLPRQFHELLATTADHQEGNEELQSITTAIGGLLQALMVLEQTQTK